MNDSKAEAHQMDALGQQERRNTSYSFDPFHAEEPGSSALHSPSSPQPHDAFGLGHGQGERSSYYDSYDDPFVPPTSATKDVEAQASDASLVKNAAPFDGHSPLGQSHMDSEYGNNAPTGFKEVYDPTDAQPVEGQKAGLGGWLDKGRYPIEQRIEDKKRQIGRQKYPFVSWTFVVVMASVLIYELVVNWKAQGTPFSFKPVVNPMLGPSSSALIHVGARFPACMKDVQAIPIDTQMACLNDTANPPDRTCSIEDICGFGGFHDKTPDQWFRFFTPIFLHAGLIHLALNMLAQATVSAQIEREMGSGGFLLTYMAAGIFGNILGGNFALVGLPSVGASGAIFGTVAVTWVDLFAHWKYQYRPSRKLAFMALELVLGVALGYIPYVDNFVHLGGFLMGLLAGLVFYPIISTTKRHKAIVWGLRLVALALAIVLFVVLTRNFYKSDPYAACSWCRYLSCFPTSSNNHCKGTGLTTTTVNSDSNSGLFNS